MQKNYVTWTDYCQERYIHRVEEFVFLLWETNITRLWESKTSRETTVKVRFWRLRPTKDRYDSLRTSLSNTIQRQDLKDKQIRFISGVRSLNEQDLWNNLKFFKVQKTSIESIHTKLSMRIFDEYSNVLRLVVQSGKGLQQKTIRPLAFPPPPSLVT